MTARAMEILSTARVYGARDGNRGRDGAVRSDDGLLD